MGGLDSADDVRPYIPQDGLTRLAATGVAGANQHNQLNEQSHYSLRVDVDDELDGAGLPECGSLVGVESFS